MTAPLQLKLFGSPQISYQGQPLTGFVSAKVRALLIYLAVTARPHSRDHLAHLLWEDTPASMKTNLRKALSNLRQLIGDLLVEEGKESVALDRQRCWVDVVEFEHSLNGGALTEAAQLYAADFLDGFNPSLSYEFEAWALREQSRLKSQMVALLHKLATQSETRNTLPEAIQTVRRLLDLEPWQEESHRWLMELLAKNGQRSAALAHFEVCKRVLQEELAVAPSAETILLVEQIRQTVDQTPQATSGTRTVQHNALPNQAMPLFGREQDRHRVAELLMTAPGRLVTLVGPPGIGKTRLGLAVAEQLQTTFGDGVYFVPLAAIFDAEFVVSTLVLTLDLTTSSHHSPEQLLIEFLHTKMALLVLDNFEQIIPAASLLAKVLEACPNVRMLVTSRERLHLYVEQLYRVPPLALPPAVALFMQRTQTLDIDFVLTPANEPFVYEICQQLDCLPLAIELSAAQIEIVTLPTLLSQVREQRLKLLSNGPRDLPARHRTLRNAIESSYQLLNEREQVLFRTVGICVGGFDQTVIDGFGFEPSTLQALIHKSLVQAVSPGDNTRRFLLLETLREYALEQLQLAGEASMVARRHAEIYMQLAEAAATQFRQTDQGYWLKRLASDHDNLRAALLWSFTNQEITISARLGIALRGFWYTRGYYAEGWQWLERLLTQIDQPFQRAKLLFAKGRYARRMGKNAAAIASFTESLALFRQLNDSEGIASSLRGLGMIHFLQDNYDQVRPLFTEALALFRQLDDQEGIAATLDGLGYVSEDVTEAMNFYHESLAIRRRAGNVLGIAISLNALAHMALQAGDCESARTYQKEHMQLNTELGNQNGIAYSLYLVGLIAFAEDDIVKADTAFEQCLALCQQTGDNSLTGIFRSFGVTSLQRGDADRARLLFEQALTHSQARGSSYNIAVAVACFACLAAFAGEAWPALCLFSYAKNIAGEFDWFERKVFERVEHEVRQQISEQEAAQAWASGRAMTGEEVVTYALTSSSKIIFRKGD